MGYIYINIFYKKLQFAAYGQFVLVFFFCIFCVIEDIRKDSEDK